MLYVHDIIDAVHHQYTYFRFHFNLCQSPNVFFYVLLAVQGGEMHVAPLV